MIIFNFNFFLKIYILLFGLLAIFAFGLFLYEFLNNHMEQAIKALKTSGVFTLFLLFGLYYPKIIAWLEKQK